MDGAASHRGNTALIVLKGAILNAYTYAICTYIQGTLSPVVG